MCNHRLKMSYRWWFWMQSATTSKDWTAFVLLCTYSMLDKKNIMLFYHYLKQSMLPIWNHSSLCLTQTYSLLMLLFYLNASQHFTCQIYKPILTRSNLCMTFTWFNGLSHYSFTHYHTQWFKSSGHTCSQIVLNSYFSFV